MKFYYEIKNEIKWRTVSPSIDRTGNIRRSAVVLPVLSPMVEFGLTELVNNPPLTWANTGVI